MLFRKSLVPTLLITMLALPTMVMATDRYREWSPQSNSLQSFIDKLNQLIDDAEKARAADRYFLRDLRNLVREYDSPWMVSIVRERFEDGDYRYDPAWEVQSGRFNVHRGYGLVNSPVNKTVTSNQKRDNNGDPGKELAIALLGELLNKNATKSSRQSSSKFASEALITLPVDISNAFSLTTELTQLSRQGGFSLNVYQGAANSSGYRLVYNPSSRYPLELQRIGNRGISIIDAAEANIFSQERPLLLEWQRDEQGNMKIMVDGEMIVSVTDRSYRQHFNGIAYQVDQGEFAMRSLSVEGTKPVSKHQQ